MKDKLSSWVCIARTGTFNDSSGQEHIFKESDLEDIAKYYDKDKSEAPLVLGHPQTNDPAFGWVKALKCENSKLYAQFALLTDKVKEIVAKGYYKHVSMSLAKDRKRLLHVGLLGAAAPAIDGLGTVSFNNEENITINFSAEMQDTNNNDGGSMSLEALQQENKELKEKLNNLQAKYDKLKGEKSEIEKGKSKVEDEKKSVTAEFTAFKNEILTNKRKERIEALVTAGKLKPAEAENTFELASAFAEIIKPSNFNAKDNKEQISAEERYFKELENKEPDMSSINFAVQMPEHGNTALIATADITSKL